MRPIYGCPENFRESLRTATATFAEIFNGILFDRSYECVYTNFEVRIALPIREVIGVLKKFR